MGMRENLIESLKRDIASAQKTLKLLEDGTLTTADAVGSGKWRDTTAEGIELYKRLIPELTAVLARMEKASDASRS